MFKYALSVFLCLLLCLLLCPTGVFAYSDITGRSRAIQDEMNCISGYMNEGEQLQWQDVCYTQPVTQNYYDYRSMQVDKTLDQVAQEHSTFFTERDVTQDSFSDRNSYGEPYYDYPDYDRRHEMRQMPDQYQRSWQDRQPAPRYYALPKAEKSTAFDAQMFWHKYTEPVFDLVNEGMFYGVHMAYTFRPAEDELLYSELLNMFKVDGLFARGKVDYSTPGSGEITDKDDYMYEIRGVVGKDYYFNPSFRATPFIGLGFRYLNDDSAYEQSTTGAWGYERESRYIYSPLGIELTKKVDHEWQVDWVGEYDIFIAGQQESHLSDVFYTWPDARDEQHQGYGLRTSLRLTKKNEEIDLFVEPFYRFWHIDDSDQTTALGAGVITVGREPENETKETGVKLGLLF